jgi:hypothetical protein
MRWKIYILVLIQSVHCQDHIHWGSVGDPLSGLTVSWHSNGNDNQIKWGYTDSYCVESDQFGSFDLNK